MTDSNRRPTAVLVLLAGLILLGSGGGGCTLMVAKAVYDSGEIRQVVAAGHDRSLAACRRVLEGVNIRIERHSAPGLTTEIDGRWPDGTTVTLRLTRLSRRTTEVAIRSGRLGVRDRAAVRLLQDRIVAELTGS